MVHEKLVQHRPTAACFDDAAVPTDNLVRRESEARRSRKRKDQGIGESTFGRPCR
jgi:hypothetical protein